MDSSSLIQHLHMRQVAVKEMVLLEHLLLDLMRRATFITRATLQVFSHLTSLSNRHS